VEGCAESHEDPRRYLRHAVVCLLGCHAQQFEAARNQEGQLRKVCSELKTYVHIDKVLLAMLDAEVAASACSLCCGVAYAVTTFPMAWISGYFGAGSILVGSHVTAATSALSASLATTSAVHVIAAAVGLAGAAWKYSLGKQTGRQLAWEATQELYDCACSSKGDGRLRKEKEVGDKEKSPESLVPPHDVGLGGFVAGAGESFGAASSSHERVAAGDAACVV